MKKWLSSFMFVSCVLGAAGAAQARAPIAVDAITTEPLHVRSGPAKHYKSHDVLPPDFPLVVGSCTRMWCQVYYSGTSGWSALPYLAFKEGGKHYNDPQLGPFYAGGPHKYGRHRGHTRVSYSVNGGRAMQYSGDTRGHAGWWTNYQRPNYHRAWQPRWWQKKH